MAAIPHNALVQGGIPLPGDQLHYTSRVTKAIKICKGGHERGISKK